MEKEIRIPVENLVAYVQELRTKAFTANGARHNEAYLIAIEQLLRTTLFSDAEQGEVQMVADMKALVDQDELISALVEAICIIRKWHDMRGIMKGMTQQTLDFIWRLYTQSPEMKRLNAVLAKYNMPEDSSLSSGEGRGEVEEQRGDYNANEEAERMHKIQHELK